MIHPTHRPIQPLSNAFTLIELLIVVAIISILASIAVPNFLDAKVRANVARVKSDMRILSTAVETYHIDKEKYPYRRGTPTLNPNYNANRTGFRAPQYNYIPPIPERLAKGNPSIHLKAAQMACLTTPIGYMSTLPVDVFSTRTPYPDNLLDYWDETQTMWFVNSAIPGVFTSVQSHKVSNPMDVGYMLTSVGPDGFLGAPPMQDKVTGWQEPSSLSNSMYYGVYDPTNGTVSAGNIYLAPQMGGLDGTGKNLFNKCYPEDLKTYWPLVLKQ